MNLWIKVGIGTVIGFAGGVATGIFIHKKMTDVEFEEVSEEEMAILEQQAEAQQKTDINPQVSEAVSSSKAHVETLSELPSDPDKMKNALQGKISYLQADQEAKEKYAKVWNTVHDYSSTENANELPVPLGEEESVDESDFDEEFLEDISSIEEHKDFDHAEPYAIDLADFYDQSNGYDKITIDWYEPHVFLDEREETIADISTYVGNIDLDKLFSKTEFGEDPDIRFIRNEGYSTDYEIVRHHRTWTETTGGSE